VITIRADGSVDPKELRVDVQGQVRFTNQDSRAHQPQSNPHLVHTDCPAINNVGVLQPGESRMTGTFDVAKACGFHDHMNPDTSGLGGTIRVAGAEGPPGPVYIKP
jgi:plastocyanin